MTARTCKYAKCGGPIPVTAREGTDFCKPRCRSAHHNEQRRLGVGTDKRLTPGSDGAGSRGGNVRSVSEARDLQAQKRVKRDWSSAIDEQIRRTLIETGYFHADDLDALGVPPEHCNLKGTRAASFANRKLMERSGVERKVSHKAANGRKAPIYRITAKGRAQLVGSDTGTPHVLPGVPGPREQRSHGEAACSPAPSVASGEPAQSNAGLPTPQGEGGATTSVPLGAGDELDRVASGETALPTEAPDAPPEPLKLDIPDSSYDRMKDAA